MWYLYQNLSKKSGVIVKERVKSPAALEIFNQISVISYWTTFDIILLKQCYKFSTMPKVLLLLLAFGCACQGWKLNVRRVLLPLAEEGAKFRVFSEGIFHRNFNLILDYHDFYIFFFI